MARTHEEVGRDEVATEARPLDVTVRSAGASGSGAAAPTLREGTMVGRYVVVEQLGEGAMGVVVRAYDPRLRREVALKVMRAGGAFRGREGKERMLREAQALAQLAHPNVVAVFDAEATEHGVCIAMEYVEGRTLRAWLHERARTWSEIVDVILAAAQGLVAAHAVGIVHRDVKPDNVLVGDDGRVRLTDFGLARAADAAHTPSMPSHSGRHDVEGLASLTRCGTVLGTPAYMAPEQHSGAIASPSSDQYALCVVLWEALYGERPFQEVSLQALANAKHRGPPEPPTGRVPRWLHAVARRGLAPDPDARWPAMDALVDALTWGRLRARRRRAILGAGVVACLGLAALGWQRWDRSVRTAACERDGESIEAVWNEAAASTLRAALLASGKSYAPHVADNVMPWLDEHAEAWRTARTEACLDARVRGSWDEDMLERSVWCLDERRMGFESLVAELSRGEGEAVERAVQSAAGLAEVTSCREADLLRRLPSPATQQREEIRAVRAQLASASASTRTGAYEDGLAHAREALARAQAIEWPPLVAQAHRVLGDALARSADIEAAEAELEAAYFGAVRAGDPLLATQAAEALVYTVGYALAQHDEGLRWSKHAEVTLELLPDPLHTLEAVHLDQVAGVRFSMAAFEEAKALNGRALALREASLGREHPSVATSLNNLANVHAALGAYDEAIELHGRALAIWEEVLGPEHPRVATSLSNLAGAHQQKADPQGKARALHERALAIRERAFGPEHPDVAASLNNLAGLHQQRGEFAQARPLHERALAIRERALGPAHPDVAQSLYGLAEAHAALGAHEEAKAIGERALAIREQAFGPQHPDVADSLNALANVVAELGAYADATTRFERALAIWEQALGKDHPRVTYALVGLAEVALLRGAPAEAVPRAERALQLRENAGASASELATARFLLARALGDSDAGSRRAIDLARAARDDCRAAGPGKADLLAEVEAWLAAHGELSTGQQGQILRRSSPVDSVDER